MFKKIEIWILYLTILLSILFSIGFGVLVRQEIEGITKSAEWYQKNMRRFKSEMHAIEH